MPCPDPLSFEGMCAIIAAAEPQRLDALKRECLEEILTDVDGLLSEAEITANAYVATHLRRIRLYARLGLGMPA